MHSWVVSLKYMVSELKEHEKDTIDISYSPMTSLEETHIKLTKTQYHQL